MNKILDVIEQLSALQVFVYVEDGKLKTRCDKSAITPEVVALIKGNKEGLLAYFAEVSGTKAKQHKTIEKLGFERCAASFAQQRMFMLDRIAGKSNQYNIPSALRLLGQLNIKAMQDALQTIVARHESLRTRFEEGENGELTQVIQPAVMFDVHQADLTHLDSKTQQAELIKWVEREASQLFDIKNDLLMRAQLLKLSEQEHVMLVTIHHITLDGWSMGVLIKEFSQLYAAFAQGQPNPLPPLPIQYADYAHWQRNWLQKEVIETQLAYWQEQLDGLPLVHSLPLDFNRPEVQSYSGKTLNTRIPRANFERLMKFCQAEGATLFMGLHAAFAVLLSRYSNTTDIVVGTPIANREQPEVAPLIGFFVNNLVMRCDLSENPTYRELMQKSKKMALDAYQHQQVPFEQIVEKLHPQRSLSYSPLFQVMLALQNNEVESVDLPGLTLRPVEQWGGASKYDLTLFISETEQDLELGWEYNTSLFRDDTITRMSGHFARLLNALLDAPDEDVFKAPMLNQVESQQLLPDWRLVATPQQCIHQLFEAQAAQTPNAIAVVLDDEVNGAKSLSFAELNSQANQLAVYLIEHKQVVPERLVGVCLERTPQMVIGILAILKAGGAYVPLDPNYPESRLKFMLEDAKLDIVLTQSNLCTAIALNDVQAVCLDNQDLQQQLSNYATDNIDPAHLGLTANHLAYVIYTSGSTGQPKGVCIEHASWLAYSNAVKQTYPLQQSAHADNKDTVLQFSSISFDIFVEELTLSVMHGGTLVLPVSEQVPEAAAFWQVAERNQVSIVTLPTAYWHQLCNDKSTASYLQKSPLQLVIVGGEAISASHLNRWQQMVGNKIRLFNTYGPTESTVISSYFEVTDFTVNGRSVPIGTATHDSELLILDSQAQLVPKGVAGELCIGGPCLSRGYLGQPALSAAKFIKNPFNPDAKARLYRTGDLVRQLSDGNLEFLGRIDHQVKIRGFRVELGEIEHALGLLDGVNEAVVLAVAGDSGDKKLVAYVASDSQTSKMAQDDQSESLAQQFIEGLREQLGQDLPQYMVPSAFVLLPELPLTRNGKVDRNKLQNYEATTGQTEYAEPTNDIEKYLCSIWQQVLGIDRVGVSDHFFELGGHSLLVMQVIAKCQEVGLAVTAPKMFALPRLSDLAFDIAKNRGSSAIAIAFKAPKNLIPDNAQQITPDMLPLVALDEAQIAAIVQKTPGGAANIQDIYPLAPLQDGMLFHHRMSENNDPYLSSGVFKIDNKQRLDGFLSALRFIIERHDVLRTAIVWRELPEPVQVVCRRVELPVSDFEWDPSMDETSQIHMLLNEKVKSIPLDAAPLLHAFVAKDPSSERYIVLLKYHHIICDHTGMEIIYKELYAHQTNSAEKLPAPTAYRDFVAHALQQAESNDAEEYFKRLLEDVETPTLPFDLVDVQGDGSQIVEIKQAVPDEVALQLRRVAKRLKVSPAVLFHSAWAILVGACSGQDDVIFGTVMSGRLQGTEGANATLGLFMNTLPLRVKLGSGSAIDLVRQVHSSLIDLLPYEQATLALAKRCSGYKGTTPLFSALLNYRHTAAPESSDKGDSMTIPGVELFDAKERTNYPITLSVTDFGSDFRLDLQIDSAVDATRFVGYIQTTLDSLVSSLNGVPGTELNQLAILPEAEYHEQVRVYNDCVAEFDKEKCIHELFEAHVATSPNTLAVQLGQNGLSYAQLNTQANQLARYLVEHRQVKPDTLVGVCVDRSQEMVVGILAIMKAGGAYVPLDPNYPKARLSYLLEDAGLHTVLSQRHLTEHLSMAAEQVLCLDDETFLSQLSQLSGDNLEPYQLALNSRHLAYVIYTSGSTGQPKGVMVEHHAAVNYLNYAINHYCDDIVGSVVSSSLSFDATITSVLSPLVAGKHLQLINPGKQEVEDLTRFIESAQQPYLFKLTPAHLELMQLSINAVKQPELAHRFVVGGEQLRTSILLHWKAQILPQAVFVNEYGPTETVVGCSTNFVSSLADINQAKSVVHIGKPIANTQLFVLSNNNQLCPVGVIGELHIGGAGLARGYLNRAQLSEEKFVANPFYDPAIPHSSQRLYKTGDLVRWLPDGHLEFHARVDAQVKIRGFRIELGEIEQTLMNCEGVNQAVVVVKQSDSGDKSLVGYLVADSAEGQSFIDEIRAQLAQLLPEYMLPAGLVLLESLPLTGNGKVDIKALPELDMKGAQATYEAPETEIETALCTIFAAILGLERVGVTDNFFELGGHSLTATRLVSAINQQFTLDISLQSIFDQQTVRQLSATVDDHIKVKMLANGELDIDDLSAEDLDRYLAMLPEEE